MSNSASVHDSLTDRSTERPLKVQRIEPAVILPSDTSHPARPDHAPSRQPRTRGVTACQTCRSRKTKCDNNRPICGYCMRTNASCVYLEDDTPSACNIYGAQILEAVQNLTSIVQNQQQQLQAAAQTPVASSPANFSTLSRGSTGGRDQYESNVLHHRSATTPRSESLLSKKDPPAPLGLESVLSWSIFDHVEFPDLFPDDEEAESETSPQVPNLSHAEFTRLISRYTTGVHVYNPVIDLSHLRRLVDQILENGLDWSSGTCLVMIVCAIGAITEGHFLERNDIMSEEVELAMKYWGVAEKRIGFAIGNSTIESIQCLCLAGIWYMHKLQPLQAWKYFSLAGNAWYANTRKKSRSHTLEDIRSRENLATVEQSLYFTIYKSECELRIELNIPGSVLADVNLPYAFPLPPHLDQQFPTSDSNITERGWYYYLAEIAARHLLNSLLRARAEFKPSSNPQDIKRLFSTVKLFEPQLNDWHASLPPILSFEIPQGKISPHTDELSNVLRFRYLSILDLLYRPFVQLCVENTLNIEPKLRRSVADKASQCLQCCMYKLESIAYNRPPRHQGSWFGLGTIATAVMVLTAASTAMREDDPSGAHELIMPKDWKTQVMRTVGVWHIFWGVKTGGVREIKQVIDWAFQNEGLSYSPVIS